MSSSTRPRTGTVMGRSFPPVRGLVRMWPWLTGLIAAVVVDLIIGGFRHFDFHGIRGFSTVNYGWLAFTLIGGVVYGWRLARRPLSPLGLLRPVLAAAVSYVLCFVLVTITGLVFLPGQSLAETLTTDAPGRSLPVAAVVLALSIVAEIVRLIVRRVRRLR